MSNYLFISLSTNVQFSPKIPYFASIQAIAATIQLRYAEVCNRGKPVVLFIMAYWCPTCFHEAEELAKLHKKYKDRVTILALDIDPSSTPQSLALFKSQVGNPDYIWAFDRGGNVARSYKIRALETTIIFDQSGKVVFKDLRSTSYRTLEKQIKLILE